MMTWTVVHMMNKANEQWCYAHLGAIMLDKYQFEAGNYVVANKPPNYQVPALLSYLGK